MPSQHKLPERRPRPVRESHGATPWIVAGAVVLLVVGGVFTWGLLRPAAGAAGLRTDDPEFVRLRDECLAIEQEFAHLGTETVPTDAELQRLQRAVDFHREWLAATGNKTPEEDRRLKDLEALHDAAWTRAMVARTKAEEAEGRSLLAAGRRDEGLAKLRWALGRQQLLNQRHAEGEGRDLMRESALEQEIKQLEAEPLAAELSGLLGEAERQLEAQQETAALDTYRRALDLQIRLNREYSRTTFASLAKQDQLEIDVATLDSAPLLAQVLELSTRATEAQARRDPAGASELFAQAGALQERLNREFPRSRHASPDRVDAIEIARQTELSAEPVARLAELEQELDLRLRNRDLAGVPDLLRNASGVCDALFVRLPRSRKLDPELRFKLNFLLLRRDEIEPVQTLVAGRLLPVPGRKARLLATEVPQRLYELVMRANPSRQPGDTLPVESVGLAEAQEFCVRLGWMLARPVRLPTEAEYRAALGTPPAEAALDAQSWSLARSGQQLHPVASAAANAAGFFDLLGNVAEWLAPVRTDADASLVAGGSYADPLAELAQVPLEKRKRLDRARTIGFRVVVE